MPSTRYHYLDAARGVLMIVGIAYHASRVYGVSGWIVQDTATSPHFDDLAAFLISFRMPCFFLISGFFAALTLAKAGPGAFVRTRAPRILVPLVTTFFTLNAVQLYAIHVHDGGSRGMLDFLFSSEVWHDFPHEKWISHLWFLVCLAWYFAGLALSSAALGVGDAGKALVDRVGRVETLVRHPAACLALLPLANVFALTVLHALPGLYAIRPVIDMNEIVDYLPFFVVGLLVFANATFYESMTRFSNLVLWLTVPVVTFELFAPVRQGLGGRLVQAYGFYLWTWIAIHWVLVFFRRVMSRPSALARTLSDSSYTIYLFHHLTVVLLAWGLVAWHVSIFLKYAVIVATTFAFTLGVHQFVISRVTLLTFLFNGRISLPRPIPQEVSSHAQPRSSGARGSSAG